MEIALAASLPLPQILPFRQMKGRRSAKGKDSWKDSDKSEPEAEKGFKSLESLPPGCTEYIRRQLSIGWSANYLKCLMHALASLCLVYSIKPYCSSLSLSLCFMIFAKNTEIYL